MIGRFFSALLALGLLGAAVYGIGQLPSISLGRATSVTPQLDLKAVCVPALGTGTLYADGYHQLGDVGQTLTDKQSPAMGEEHGTSVAMQGPDVMVGGIVSNENDQQVWVPCQAAVSGGQMVLPSAQNTTMLVVNSDPLPATVDLQLHGPEGEISALGARGIALTPGETREIALSVLANTEGPVAVTMSTTSGRASVVARMQSPELLDALTLSSQGNELLLATAPAGSSKVSVTVFNPSNERASVNVEVFGPTTRFIPVGGEDLQVEPNSTATLTLDGVVGEEVSTFSIKSETPVVASGFAGADKGGAYLNVTTPGEELRGVATAAGSVHIANPGSQPAQVNVAGQDITVQPGTTATVSVGEAGVINVTSDVAVTATFTAQDQRISVPLVALDSVVADELNSERDPRLR